MGENEDVLERVRALEEQVKSIAKIETKIDALFDLVRKMEIDAASTKLEYASKEDLMRIKEAVEKRLDEIETGKRKLFWAAIAAAFTFVVFLLEQLLHISISVGK